MQSKANSPKWLEWRLRREETVAADPCKDDETWEKCRMAAEPRRPVRRRPTSLLDRAGVPVRIHSHIGRYAERGASLFDALPEEGLLIMPSRLGFGRKEAPCRGAGADSVCLARRAQARSGGSAMCMPLPSLFNHLCFSFMFVPE